LLRTWANVQTLLNKQNLQIPCALLMRCNNSLSRICSRIISDCYCPIRMSLTINFLQKQKTLEKVRWKRKERACGSTHILHLLLLFCLSVRRQNFKRQNRSRHTPRVVTIVRHTLFIREKKTRTERESLSQRISLISRKVQL